MWGRNHPWVVDTLVALGLCAFGWLSMATTPADPHQNLHELTTSAYVLNVVGTLPLLVRRRHPLVVFAITWVATLFYVVGMYPGGGPILGTLFAIYACAAHAPSRRAGLVAMAVAGLTSIYFFFVPELKTGLDDALSMYAFLVTAWLLGDNMRIRRAYVTTVEERAERLERERDVEAQRAVLEERARIARELHDVVAHGMSVMVVQAGAARRTLSGSPELAAEAIGNVESTGRSALEEMRRLVSVLRASTDGTEEVGEAPRLPQPQPDDLDKLIVGCRDAGLDVSLQVSGDERPLPPGLGLVVYRIVQEALTNTIRHAGPARASVCLDYQPEVVTVTVTDDGRGAAAEPPSGGPGHGLAGMRERVVLYGGRLTAGPQAGGGFRVVARLPAAAERTTV